MRVVCAFVDHPSAPGLHRDTDKALRAYAPKAERYELGMQDDAYYMMLSQVWLEGEGFLNVEQDVELHEEVIPQLEACPELLCVFPYEGGKIPGTEGDGLIRMGLGCTRFSTELLQAEPDLMMKLPVRGWRRLDSHILPYLFGKGYESHLHWPEVKHHHIYTAHGVSWCACGGHAVPQPPW
jgi:hypothetical protein